MLLEKGLVFAAPVSSDNCASEPPQEEMSPTHAEMLKTVAACPLDGVPADKIVRPKLLILGE